MIKWIFCKLGFHRYSMRHFMLTSSIATEVKCKWCGTDLRDESEKEWVKKREKMLNKMANEKLP